MRPVKLSGLNTMTPDELHDPPRAAIEPWLIT
jgi:hypothetical protein